MNGGKPQSRVKLLTRLHVNATIPIIILTIQKGGLEVRDKTQTFRIKSFKEKFSFRGVTAERESNKGGGGEELFNRHSKIKFRETENIVSQGVPT